MPLVLIMEFVFSVIYRNTDNVGIAIVAVSLAVNFLSLPLYKRADAIQDEERRMQKLMADPVKHIRKTFHGDERFMMLQAYYGEQNYSPLFVFRGSLPLLLQIPFFTAAYNYLSNLSILKGTPFWIFSDMGAPDQLLTIFGITLNILPILMTAINFISGMIYTRGFPLKDKAQLYILALVFLVLLYDRPAGLVFYWTLNNLFSLSKNVVMKLIFAGKEKEKKPIRIPAFMDAGENAGKIFLGSALCLTAVFGLLIPMSVVSAAPEDFVDVFDYVNPLSYVMSSVSISAGYFLLWLGAVVYFFGNKKSRSLQAYIFFLAAGISLMNYMCFGKNFGTLTTTLVFSETPEYGVPEITMNIFAIIVLCLVLTLIYRLKKEIVPWVMLAIVTGSAGFTVYKSALVNSEIAKIDYIEEGRKNAKADPSKEAEKIVKLSRNGRNVVVILLDRAISGYVPYIFNERPSLKEQFSGFTYYPNTISFAIHTTFAAPAVYGGYEYTPAAMNRRGDVSLARKTDESDILMPLLFSNEGYESTICDPSYAGYKAIPDLSIYDDYPDIHAYNTKLGEYTYLLSKDELDSKHGEIIYRNFFWYSIYKTAPLILQKLIYDGGDYFGTTKSHIHEDFLRNYAVLKNLSYLTDISDDSKGSFFMIHNNTSHSPSVLQMPDYTPAAIVNNTGLDDPSRFTINGKTVDAYKEKGHAKYHYHVNMASFIQLGKWFDYLKSEGIYDNTRIIIVADHGFNIGQFDWMIVDDKMDIEGYNPLLMVKDFASAGEPETDDSFMTNADVPSMAFKDIIEDPVNPFTGNPVNDDAKDKEEMLITTSHKWQLSKQSGNVFDTGDSRWYTVKNDIFDLSNWKIADYRKE